MFKLNGYCSFSVILDMHGVTFLYEDGSEMDVDTTAPTAQVSIKHGTVYLGFPFDLIFIGEHANFLSNWLKLMPLQVLHV
jgi:hypothetical protein